MRWGYTSYVPRLRSFYNLLIYLIDFFFFFVYPVFLFIFVISYEDSHEFFLYPIKKYKNYKAQKLYYSLCYFLYL